MQRRNHLLAYRHDWRIPRATAAATWGGSALGPAAPAAAAALVASGALALGGGSSRASDSMIPSGEAPNHPCTGSSCFTAGRRRKEQHHMDKQQHPISSEHTQASRYRP